MKSRRWTASASTSATGRREPVPGLRRGRRSRRGRQGKRAPAGGGDAAGAGSLLDAAVTAAKSADVTVVVAGLYRNQDQEGRDRANFNLPPGQAELIQAVCKANPRTVVVLNGGSPSSVDPWLENCGCDDVLVRRHRGRQCPGAGPLRRRQSLRPSALHLAQEDRRFSSALDRQRGRIPGCQRRRRRRTRCGDVGHRRPAGELLRGHPGRLPLVRREEDRAAVPLRLRVVLYHVFHFRPQGAKRAPKLRYPAAFHAGQAS